MNNVTRFKKSSFMAKKPKLYEIKMRKRLDTALAQVNQILKNLIHKDTFFIQYLYAKLRKLKLENPGKDISIPMLKESGLASGLLLVVPFKEGGDFSSDNFHSQVMLVTKNLRLSVILSDVKYFENQIVLSRSFFGTLGTPDTGIQVS